MSAGNYDHDHFVRVDCAASAEQMRVSAVHETAHLTLATQSFWGLLCFFLHKDTQDARSRSTAALRILEQAFECTNECYARAKELLLCTSFPAADPSKQEKLLAMQHEQPYFSRYHMERLTPILRQYDAAARCPLFPDQLFLIAAETDVSPLLDGNFTDAHRLQSLILDRPAELYPDHRLALLLQAFSGLLRRIPPEQITVDLLCREASIHAVPLSTHALIRFFDGLAAAFPNHMELQSLSAYNRRHLRATPYSPPTPETLTAFFYHSLADNVVPFALERRFSRLPHSKAAFRPEQNILRISFQPETICPPALLSRKNIHPGPCAAFFQFGDTHAGIFFSPLLYSADLTKARRCLDRYSGAVYLYLDDYTKYHCAGPFRSSPVFFRCDVPWNDLESQCKAQGFQIRRAFLQRYTDSVFFFFGYDGLNNVVFSMLPHWELSKIRGAFDRGAFTACGALDADCYGPHPWHTFRDIIAAAAEDRTYSRMDQATFRRLRLL